MGKFGSAKPTKSNLSKLKDLDGARAYDREDSYHSHQFSDCQEGECRDQIQNKPALDVQIRDDSLSLGSGNENIGADEEESPLYKKASFKLSEIEDRRRDLGLILSN